ncbi:MAG: MATE family efflux transporter, partial [Mesorhizobium sp.]
MDQVSATANRRSFVVTNRSVLAIAVPMTLAYLTTPLLGIVDTAVIGQFG